MTLEHKIVVGLGDIKAVIFECRAGNCRARLTVSTEKMRIPTECPYCSKTWISGEQKSSFQPETSQQTALIDALEKVKVLEANGATFRILLEFEDESSTLEKPSA